MKMKMKLILADSINTPNEDNNVKTIVIDTKQTANDRKFDNDRILEIGTESARKKYLINIHQRKREIFVLAMH